MVLASLVLSGHIKKVVFICHFLATLHSPSCLPFPSLGMASARVSNQTSCEWVTQRWGNGWNSFILPLPLPAFFPLLLGLHLVNTGLGDLICSFTFSLFFFLCSGRFPLFYLMILVLNILFQLSCFKSNHFSDSFFSNQTLLVLKYLP